MLTKGNICFIREISTGDYDDLNSSCSILAMDPLIF